LLELILKEKGKRKIRMSLTTAVFIVIGTQGICLIMSEMYQERRHKKILDRIDEMRVSIRNEISNIRD
jgi:hypothetical protein